jgi:hypothetical protein
MNVLRRLFSKPIDPNKVIDFATGSLDRLNFTNQERADYNAKQADSLAKFVELTLNESTDKSVTRRYLSIIIVSIYLVIVLATIALAMIVPEKAKIVMDVCDAYYMQTAFIMVLAFFYGGYYISGIIKQK